MEIYHKELKIRKNIVFEFLIAITLANAAGCNQYVLLPYPVPGGSSTQSDNIYVISGDIGNVNLQNIINNYDGIKGPSKENPVEIPVSAPLKIAKDFTFDGVKLVSENTSGASSFSMRSAGNEEEPIGIDLSSSTGDITLTIKNSTISGFGYAIKSNKATGNKEANGTVNGGSLTLIIENSDFSDCFKGLYATDIKDLTITGSTFINMGTDAAGEDVVKRSGSAIDVNQMSAGGTITITNSTFTNCGSTKGTTSGAIKVKVRGGSDDEAKDIPATNVNGSLTGGLIIKDCTFSDNRRDVVIGTSQYASTGNFKYDIQEGCDIENNSLNYLILTGATSYGSIKDKISSYIGIKGKAESEVVLTVDEPIVLDDSFIFENITLKGNATTPIGNSETPYGIKLNNCTNDVTLTLKHVKISNFGYAISSNKADGKKSEGDGGTVKGGSLTLIIDRSEFSDCFKGLYATDIKNLTVTNSKFSNMGEAADGEDVVKRSGSAIDVNQMSTGEIISITNSEFTNCGKSGREGTTSGAIKVKVRGGEKDEATDIPATAAGKLSKLIVKNCEFSDNRADVVIGTSGYSTTDDFTFEKDLQDSQIENNAVKEN